MDSMIRANVLVYGKVQGVFFRASTFEEAQRLRVVGWVQNLSDGGVEILVEGNSEAVGELVEWARHGPSSARVDDIKVRYDKWQGEFDTFRILH